MPPVDDQHRRHDYRSLVASDDGRSGNSPGNARRIQEEQAAHIRLHVFDILRYCGEDITPLPLIERQEILAKALRLSDNAFIEEVPSFVVNKPAIHHRIIDSGGEGTVWKKADSPYQPGQRVPFWIKQKRGTRIDAFISDAKEGTNGNAGSIGAVQFSVKRHDGSIVPIAWVSNLSDRERRILTDPLSKGHTRLAAHHLGRRAVLAGQDVSARARRIRHARLIRWVDPIEE